MGTRTFLALVFAAIVFGVRPASLSPPSLPVMQLIRDINTTAYVGIFCRPGFGGGVDSCPWRFLPLVDDVTFLAFDPVNGYGLWRTDGTRRGTSWVRELNSLYFWYTDIEAGSGVIFFLAHDRDGRFGTELWRSDGTRWGTSMVADLNPGPASGMTNGGDGMIHVAGTLYFAGNDGVHGFELWTLEAGLPVPGTSPPPAPQLLKDINPGAGHGVMALFVNAGSTVFFGADDGLHGYELWKSDGTADGTVLVTDLLPGPESAYPRPLAVLGNRVLFDVSTYDPAYEWLAGLWISDGTAAGTVRLAAQSAGVHPGNGIIVAGDRAFLSGWTPETGTELWVTDGTVAGTHLIESVPGPGGLGYVSSWRGAVGNNLLFSPFPDSQVGAGELWISDGTVEGTRLLKDIEPGYIGSGPRQFTTVGNVVFFSANNSAHGEELWVTDGTTEGTRLVRDLNPGPASSWPQSLAAIGGVLYLSADDGVRGFEPWKVTP